MDRRIIKTRQGIFKAFLSLLKEKRYSNISVQNIIDRANVGRSTFYSHFETKDALLDAFCYELFDHVFTKDVSCDIPIEFDKRFTFEQKATHILYHFKDSKRDMVSILNSENSDLFWQIFKDYLKRLFSDNIKKHSHKIPQSYIESLYLGSFIETIKWWMGNDMAQSPETVILYFTGMLNL
ncbi:MAG: TetR family transcriptional regulator [Christensenellaceae bacterium]|nr:TetR family transcriptional regulator [Christensenellaceae bacterium]